MNQIIKTRRAATTALVLLFAIGIVGIAGISRPALAQKPASSPKPAQAVSPKALTDGMALATDKIKDMTATLVVQEVDRDELRKIGGAFATTYSIKRMNVSYQYPSKARFDGKILGAALYLVYNGDKKTYHIPGRTETRDIKGQPGQKQTLMDLGIFSRDYLTNDYAPTYLRTEKGLPVYRLSQRGTPNKSHEIVWVNPKTAIIERRLSYNGDNKLIKEIRFLTPVQIRPDVWVPTRVEVYNAEGKFGVAQSLEDIKINLGVDESLFANS